MLDMVFGPLEVVAGQLFTLSFSCCTATNRFTLIPWNPLPIMGYGWKCNCKPMIERQRLMLYPCAGRLLTKVSR